MGIMIWQPLVEVTAEIFFRGAVFRCPAKHPFERVVDFMIIEDLDSPSRYKIICSTGYHAGQTEWILPAEAAHPKGGISVKWLKAVWSKSILGQSPVKEVLHLEHYPSNFGAVAPKRLAKGAKAKVKR
jgi:Immunity protein 45